jgi:acetyl-CoA acetyltransferase
MTRILESRAIISGVGLSDTGRHLGLNGLELTLDAALAAVKDAGLRIEDIDGMCSMGETPVNEVKNVLGMQLSWLGPSGVQGAGGHLRYVVQACMAVATSLCNHVLVYRSVSMMRGEWRQGITGDAAWQLPFYGYTGATMVAMHARRHMHDYGTTREQLASIAIVCREHAALNPQAAMRKPMGLDDYLGARWITEPLCLLDCDVPIDGAMAMVVSRPEHAQDCPNPVVRFEAIGTATFGQMSWDQRADYPATGARDAAAHMWSRTNLKPSDVDVAELYDGFTFLALEWLEALRFCKTGEGGAFVQGGKRIRLGGELPINTYGGQLSAGRLHGYWLLHEAVMQLRHQAGERQVKGAEVAIAAAGGGPNTGCLLLTR